MNRIQDVLNNRNLRHKRRMPYYEYIIILICIPFILYTHVFPLISELSVLTGLVNVSLVQGNSMMPTLEPEKDILYSIKSSIAQGDIVVFPCNAMLDAKYCVKRVAAMPGDKVTYLRKKDQLIVNGAIIDKFESNSKPDPFSSILSSNLLSIVSSVSPVTNKNKVKDLVCDEESFLDVLCPVIDSLIDSVLYTKFSDSMDDDYNITDFIVPNNYIFVVGDNRVHSTDSRFVGPVPIDGAYKCLFKLSKNNVIPGGCHGA